MEQDKNKTLKIIKEIQLYAEQMKQDDIDENPEAASEYFQCDCCGEPKTLAGSVVYVNSMFCNDCVILAETSMSLNKIKDPRELIDLMDDKRFETLYNDLFGDKSQEEASEENSTED